MDDGCASVVVEQPTTMGIIDGIKNTINRALGIQIAATPKHKVDDRKLPDSSRYTGHTLWKKMQRRAVTRRNIEQFGAPAGTKSHRRWYYLYNKAYFQS